MKPFFLSLSLLSLSLLVSCKDQINTPQPGGAVTDKIVFSTLNYSIPNSIPSVKSVNADGSNSVSISNPGLLLSASGDKILWAANNSLSAPDLRIANNTGGDMHLINMTLASDEAIDNTQSLVLSPDGTRFTFGTHRTGDGLYRLFVMNVDGTGKKEITTAYNHQTTPCFSPDGNDIAYFVSDNGSTTTGSIEACAINGTNRRTLASITDGDGRVLWSKLGHVTYTDDFKIYSVNPDGSNNQFMAYGIAWSWSPDGTKLAFAGDTANISDPTFFEIYYTSDLGISKVNVTNTPQYNEGFPEWSSDGSTLIVTRWEGGFNNALPTVETINITSLATKQIDSPGAMGYFVK